MYDTEDDINFEENKSVSVTVNIDYDAYLRFIGDARNSGISVNDLIEFAVIRESDFREGEKRYMISDLVKPKKVKYKELIDKIIKQNGQDNPEWD